MKPAMPQPPTRPPRKPPLALPPSPSPLRGSLDRVESDGTLEGWCWSAETPRAHRTVAITIDGHVVARAACNRARADLAEAGRGDGDHGFLLRLAPGLLRQGAAAEIALRDVASGQLVGAPVRVTWGNGHDAAPARAARPPLSGNLDRVTRDGWVSGWCWDPQRPNRRVPLDVLVDGAVVGTTPAANWRGDLQQAGIGDGGHGFAYALPYEIMAQKGTLHIGVRESGPGGRALGDAVTLRIGRLAESEQRIAALERQVRALRGKLEALEGQASEQPAAEERAARALFGTVAAFFRELADGTPQEQRGFGLGGGLRATLDELAARLAPLALRQPAHPEMLVIVPATRPVEAVHRCLSALHRAGIDARADIVLLDPGDADARTALLPSLVGGLRYEHCAASGLPAACNAALARSAARLAAVIDPDVEIAPEWPDAMLATFAAEDDAALVGSPVLRADGTLQHGGFKMDRGGRLSDPALLADADRSEHRFLRPVDAVAALAFAVDREKLLAAGGFDPGFRGLGHAVAAACLALRRAGGAVLVQPAAPARFVAADDDPGRILPDPTGADEDARRLRLALLAPPDGGGGAGRAESGFVGHALVVDDALPRPDRDAGSVAALAQMRVLRRLGWRVTFAPASGAAADEADRARLERLGIEVAVPPQHPSVAQYLRDAGAGLGLVQIVRHANAAALAPLVRELAPGAKLLFAPADLHFLRESREVAVIGGGKPDAPVRRQLRTREVACVRAADATLLLSDHERDLLAAETDPAKLHLLRWIAEPGPPGADFAGRDGLLFVGNFAHRPNVDAVRWYAQAIRPVLRRLRPGLVLHVVGADPPPDIAGLAGADIVVHGWVRDLDSLLARMRLSIAPLRYGAGFKGKVASSLAQGLPVVGTPIAFEGTGLDEGDGIAIARAPAALARAVARLHDDPAAWQALSARARERVAALYSPAAAAAIYRRLLASLDLPFR